MPLFPTTGSLCEEGAGQAAVAPKARVPAEKKPASGGTENCVFRAGAMQPAEPSAHLLVLVLPQLVLPVCQVTPLAKPGIPKIGAGDNPCE